MGVPIRFRWVIWITTLYKKSLESVASSAILHAETNFTQKKACGGQCAGFRSPFDAESIEHIRIALLPPPPVRAAGVFERAGGWGRWYCWQLSEACPHSADAALDSNRNFCVCADTNTNVNQSSRLLTPLACRLDV